MSKQNKYIYLFLFFTLVWLVVLFTIQHRKESFTPRINQLYRPYFRHVRKYYESFTTYFSKDSIMNKLRKLNIY